MMTGFKNPSPKELRRIQAAAAEAVRPFLRRLNFFSLTVIVAPGLPVTIGRTGTTELGSDRILLAQALRQAADMIEEAPPPADNSKFRRDAN